MKQILNAFYSEPVVALGVISTAAAVLGSEGVIVGWLAGVIVGVAAVLTRHFVTPAQP